MENDEELLYRLAITFLPQIGPVNAKVLVSHCGSAEAVFREKRRLLARIPGIGTKRVAAAFSEPVLPRAEKELAFVRRHGISMLFFTDDNYPRRLLHCNDAPPLLFYKGVAGLNDDRYVAIVGTRSATPYGEEVTHQLVEGLKEYNVCIVSGLAYGIDISAHTAALEAGLSTIGVTAHGLDRIYPYAHRAVAKKMLGAGGLLTEYPSRTVPDRENFPSRNRIVAGLVDAVVVVEASGKGGALITADLAAGYHRDVFAVPGRVVDAFSKGCNDYIRENKAALITGAEDLLWMMGWKDHVVKKNSIPKQVSLFMELDETETRVMKLFNGQDEHSWDSLLSGMQLPPSRLSSVLLELELKGVLKSTPGRRYKVSG